MGQATSLYDEAMPTWHDVPGSATDERGPAHLCDTLPATKAHMTLYTNLMERRCVDNGSRNIFGWRTMDPVTGQAGDYEWVTYAHFLDQVAIMSAAMVHELGLKRQENVGVFSKNRYEWVLFEHGVNRMAYQLVPLYDTLGPEAVPFIVNQTEMRVLFVGKQQYEMFEEVTETQKQEARAKGVELKSLREILEAGKKKSPVDADPPVPSDVATICYTLGTSGTPKGVVLSHFNLVMAGTEGGHLARVVASDVHLSYLPLAHVFERLVQIPVLAAGGLVGFSQGDVAKLLDDIAALRPTGLAGVPRVFNRIHGRILQRVENAGGLKQALFNHAFKTKRSHLEQAYVTHALWDKVVFRPIQQLVGGRVRIIISSSAPIMQDCREFLQVVFSCPVIEAYGLTETSGTTTMSSPAFRQGVHVGGPVPDVQVCLLDVRQMNYTSSDTPAPRGEICVKGPTLFQGYYKDPELTADVIDADGWFHTGDIGQWNPDGTLSIIDRKKNMFKLAQGEYITPEKIENIYSKSSLVAQVFVHGVSLESYAVGVVVPDREGVVEWAKRENLGVFTPNDAAITRLLLSKQLKDAVLADLQRVAIKHGLAGFERVKNIHVDTEHWSVENDRLTPTFKIRRVQLRAHYAAQLQAMFTETPFARAV